MRFQASWLTTTIIATGFGAISASADQITHRSDLAGILGGTGTIEDFESFGIAPTGAVTLHNQDGSALTSLDTSTVAYSDAGIQGPGLVMPGATYFPRIADPTLSPLQWNGSSYFGLQTKAIVANGSDAIVIEYSDFVTAMGVDVGVYEGFGGSHQARVYDLADNLIAVHDFTMQGAAGERFFFGWEHAAGISKIEVYHLDVSWSAIIDDHLYGVPAPSAIIPFGLAGLFATRRRRRL